MTSDTWVESEGSFPSANLTPVTTPTVEWKGGVVVPTGEVKPGIRSSQIMYAKADPLKREFSLGEIQKRYTALVRFGAFNKASKFVDPEIAAEFVSNFPTQDDLVFTDHESERIDFGEDEDKATATVRVTYSAYYTHSPVVFEVIEVQNWYRDGVGNDWRVRPEFTGLEKFAAAN